MRLICPARQIIGQLQRRQGFDHFKPSDVEISSAHQTKPVTADVPVLDDASQHVGRERRRDQANRAVLVNELGIGVTALET